MAMAVDMDMDMDMDGGIITYGVPFNLQSSQNPRLILSPIYLFIFSPPLLPILLYFLLLTLDFTTTFLPNFTPLPPCSLTP